MLRRAIEVFDDEETAESPGPLAGSEVALAENAVSASVPERLEAAKHLLSEIERGQAPPAPVDRLRQWKESVGKEIDADRYELPSADRDNEWLLWKVALDVPEIVPPFYFTNAELAATPTAPDVRSRLAARQLAEVELRKNSSIREGTNGQVVCPDYDEELERRRLYGNLDADLLLRHLDKADWRALCEAADSFSNLAQEYIRLYWR